MPHAFPKPPVRGAILTLEVCFEKPLMRKTLRARRCQGWGRSRLAGNLPGPFDLCLNWTTDLELDMRHTRPVNLIKK